MLFMNRTNIDKIQETVSLMNFKKYLAMMWKIPVVFSSFIAFLTSFSTNKLRVSFFTPLKLNPILLFNFQLLDPAAIKYTAKLKRIFLPHGQGQFGVLRVTDDGPMANARVAFHSHDTYVMLKHIRYADLKLLNFAIKVSIDNVVKVIS